MASPAPSALSPTAADGAPPPTKTQEQITFRFCRECSNMLYPKEDRLTNKLMFACRTCQFSEEASSSCVFRNNMYNTVGETAGVTQDVGSDPTVCDVLCFRVFDLCCTLCGVVLVEREEEEEEEEDELGEEEKDRGVRMFDLGDMGNADDEMNGSRILHVTTKKQQRTVRETRESDAKSRSNPNTNPKRRNAS